MLVSLAMSVVLRNINSPRTTHLFDVAHSALPNPAIKLFWGLIVSILLEIVISRLGIRVGLSAETANNTRLSKSLLLLSHAKNAV